MTDDERAAIKAAYPEFYEHVYQEADDNNIYRQSFNTLAQEECTSEKATAAVRREDRTKGSCASASYAYVGRRAGYDVLDFRGGYSQDLFSDDWVTSIYLAQCVDGEVIAAHNEVKAGEQLLSSMVKGKEYILSIGSHTSVVRLFNGKYQYLELQSKQEKCGWKDFIMGRDISCTLIRRFNCKLYNRYLYNCALLDTEKLSKFDGFKGMLEYINTSQSKKRAGKGGGIK
ncbi:MAG: hypothetical protein LUI04_06070 [Porphyromonadaceae bacterium]|nr:hypothetical protein [Porphyromonadaceae bacterium]